MGGATCPLYIMKLDEVIMASISSLKQRNMLAIIRVIKSKVVITKPEIAKLAGLTQSTVHNFTNELLEKKIIAKEGVAKSNGGRKAITYRLNAERFFVIALDIGDSYISICLHDLNFQEKFSKSIPYILYMRNIDKVLQDILNLIQELLEQSQTCKNDVLGIGISISGTVDFPKRMIYQITNAPKWRNIPLAKMIEDRTGIQTIIDKNYNNAVLYYKAENTTEKNNLVYFSTKKGIGTSLLIEGNVYRGSHCLAGEFGHMCIDFAGEVCKCGRTGCIEPLASDQGIVQRVKQEIRGGANSIVAQICTNKLDFVTLGMVIKAAQLGDLVALDTLYNVAEYLSLALSNIIKIYDPDEIIIDSGWLQHFGDVFNTIKDNVYEDNSFLDRDRLSITLAKEDNILLLGATSLILDHHLNSYTSSKFL